MKKKITEAVKAGDTPRVRELVMKFLRENPGKTDTLVAVRYAMDNTPDLFEKEVGTFVEAPKSEWNADYRGRLEKDLERHFTSSRLRHYTEVCAELAMNPHSKTAPAAVSEVAGCADVCAVTEDPAESLSAVADAQAAREERATRGKPSALRIVGYVLFALGAATSITGICIGAVKFLIGVGIGVMMLAIALLYLAMRRN